MKEVQFRQLWNDEKQMYAAWGDRVVELILNFLEEQGHSINELIKIPPKPRLKEEQSLCDKAFNRAKAYKNPYDEIEDKIGVRFVVLLNKDVDTICNAIANLPDFASEMSRDYNEERREAPLLFTYQSNHFIVRPKRDITISETLVVKSSTPCEVQIRTLLQHAHAELTHDTIYKTKKRVESKVHRTVAKSMALIETTDDFFTTVSIQLNHGPLEEFRIVERLDGIFDVFVGNTSHNHRSAAVIFDVFSEFISEDIVDNIQKNVVSNNPHLADCIRSKYMNNSFYHQSVILFVYWMLIEKKARLLRDWPIDEALLASLATDLGVSIR